MQYYPITHKKQTDKLNSTHENISEDIATFQARCNFSKHYFSVKLRNHAKNWTDIFEGPIKILGMPVFFSRDGRQP